MRRTAKTVVGAAGFAGVLVCVAGIAATPASAADIPAKAPAYKPAPPAAPVHTWTGLYVGANGGCAWHDRTMSLSPNDPLAGGLLSPAAAPLPNPSFDLSGGFGGVQVGYNWQFNPSWILGLEADFQLGDIKGDGTSTNFFVVARRAAASETIKWFGTVRARIGYLIANEVVVYGTGGFAYGRVEQQANWALDLTAPFGQSGFGAICTANVPCYAGSSSSVRTGWTAGAGAEWAIWANLTLKAEYLYVDLRSNSFNMIGLVVTPGFQQSSANVRSDVDFHSIRAGLNFRF